MHEKQIQQADRWYRQAIDDLEAAEALLTANKYAPACFYSQQTGEKAIRAVGYFLDLTPRGHSCTKLIQQLPESAQALFKEATEAALASDKLYIQTRYPSALAELTPSESFTKKEAQSAIASSQKILDSVSAQIYKSKTK